MKDDDLQHYFKPGDILAYYNHADNALHHQTWFGKVIEYGQGFFKNVDPRITHISLIEGFDRASPDRGFTRFKIVDILRGKLVQTRSIEHNYAYRIFRLHPEWVVHPNFTSEDLAKQAVIVANKFKGAPYHHGSLASVMCSKHKIDQNYLRYLVDRFQINFENQTINMFECDGLICAELTILCYQVAWLLLAGKQAIHHDLPECLNIHALSTPAELAQHLISSPAFQEVDHQYIEALRYSGKPHEKDYEDKTYVTNRLIQGGYLKRSAPTANETPAHPHGNSNGPAGRMQHW